MLMFLPIFSALLGILAFNSKINLSFLGLFFLIPFFIFLAKEKKLYKLLLGTFFFRFIWVAGVAYFAWNPIIFFLLSLVFFGLPLSIYFLKKLLKKRVEGGKILIWLCLPFLWIFWEYLQAHYNFISTFIVTSGNILGDSPFLGLSAFGGFFSLIFFAALTNALGAFLIINFKKRTGLSFFLLGALTFLILGGLKISQIALKKNLKEYQARKNTIQVAVISNNNVFDEDLKKQVSEKSETPISQQIDDFLISVKEEILKSGKKIDLLLGPEHFIDLAKTNLPSGPDADELLIKAYGNLAKDLNVNFVVVFANYQKDEKYNSAFLFNREGSVIDIYNKIRLMLTGEVFPKQNGKSYFKKGNQIKLLNAENFSFGPALCSEIHYPTDMNKLKKMDAQFIYNPSSNCWVPNGLNKYLQLIQNLRKIMAVSLKMPIIVAGRLDRPEIVLPNGEINSAGYESPGKNYGIFMGEIRI